VINNSVRAALRGIFMGAFFINIFTFIMIMEAWGAGLVGDSSPLLVIASAVLCLFGYHQNKHRDDEDG
jgi:drug/metabolite transporter (DMT)-like permease